MVCRFIMNWDKGCRIDYWGYRSAYYVSLTSTPSAGTKLKRPCQVYVPRRFKVCFAGPRGYYYELREPTSKGLQSGYHGLITGK